MILGHSPLVHRGFARPSSIHCMCSPAFQGAGAAVAQPWFPPSSFVAKMQYFLEMFGCHQSWTCQNWRCFSTSPSFTMKHGKLAVKRLWLIWIENHQYGSACIAMKQRVNIDLVNAPFQDRVSWKPVCVTHTDKHTQTQTHTHTRTHRYKINVYIYIHTYHDWMIKSHQIILFMTALTSLNDCSIPQKDNICPCKCFLKYVELGCPSWPLVRRSNMTNHFDDNLGPPMI